MTSRVETIAEILWHRYSPDHEDSWPSPNADEYRRVASDILSTLTTEPAAPEMKTLVHEPMVWTGEGPYGFSPAAPKGEQEAARIGDAVLAWMIKYDLLDGEQEYYVADVIAVLDDLTPLTRPAEQAVTEAMVEAAAIAISGGRKDLWDSFDLFKRASFRTRALHALKAAMEAGR